MYCCSSICSGEKNSNLKIVTVNYSNKYTRVIGYTVNNVINMVVVDDKNKQIPISYKCGFSDYTSNRVLGFWI